MHEFFPVLAGPVIVLLVMRSVPVKARNVAIAILAVLCGIMASFISGELLESPAFILMDTALVLFGAGVALVALKAMSISSERER